jgi:hypothetical protein
VYLSTDRSLDAGDTLIQQGTIGPLNANQIMPTAFNGTWPATGVYWLIFKIHSTDDSFAGNDVIFAPHPSVIGNYRYVEDGTFNDDTGLAPNQVSHTGTTLAAGQTLVIEATMDSYLGSDTFEFGTNASKLSVRADWSTDIAANNLDLSLWHIGGTVVNQGSNTAGAESEPDVGTMDTIVGIPAGTYYVSAYMWLDENATPPGGTYTIFVKGQ